MTETISYGDHTGYAPTATGGGYICESCGAWTADGQSHICYQPSTFVFVPTTFSTIDSQRLAELMEAEKKLKEIQHILDK